jgi:hypothetical protein
LIGLAQAACETFFHTPEKVGYAIIKQNNHREVRLLRSTEFRQFLSKLMYDSLATAPSSEALTQAVTVLQAKALFDGEEHEVHTRVAHVDGKVYLDLGDPAWRCVAIGPDGWKIIPQPESVRFRRPSSMFRLPDPTPGGKVDQLWAFTNLLAEDRVLFATWVLYVLRGQGPYPILIINGEQGSAKTTLAQILKWLVDPCKGPTRGTPKDEENLMITAANCHVILFDNVSYLKPELADALCRLSTGGGLSKRQLFTDDEEMVFDLTKPIIITGIEPVAYRGDLADRAVILNLPKLDDKQGEGEFKARFDKARPALLGALLDCLSQALGGLSSVRLEKPPRMVDFARLGIAAEEFVGFPAGDFIQTYGQNRLDAGDSLLESSPVARHLRQFMEGKKTWEGTATDLLDQVNGLATEGERRRKSWPAGPNVLSGALSRLAPSLRQVGIDIDRGRKGHDRQRLIQLRSIAKSSSASSRATVSGDTKRVRRSDGAADDKSASSAASAPSSAAEPTDSATVRDVSLEEGDV